MNFIKSIIVTAMGFLLGMVLAGVGGLSAETLFYRFSPSENTKNIEKYWADTELAFSDVEALISNNKCKSSVLYAKACINAILQSKDDSLSEKEDLEQVLQSKINFDFTLELKKIFSKTASSRQAIVSAQIINSFMSIYFDPHTYILPTDFYNQVGSKVERSKYFVGVSYERNKGEFSILKVAKNSDADLAGLKAEDKILSINKKKLHGLDYSDVSQILRNERTEKFDFLIQRGAERILVKLNRSYRLLSHVQFNRLEQDLNYGLVTLTKFSKGVCAEIKSVLTSAENKNLQGLALDLRDNPGGQLDEAACVAGLFLGRDKKAFYIEYLNENKSNELILTSEEKVYSGPLVVMINSRSASAAESLSGALQDYHRALLVGRRSFGKGTFQEPEEWVLKNKISLFKTQGFYLLPSRNATQAVGVQPDIEIELPVVKKEKREGDLFYRPLIYKGPKYAKLKNSELVPNPIASDCQVNSRIKNNTTDDLVLQTSLNVLSCAQKQKLSLMQPANSSIN